MGVLLSQLPPAELARLKAELAETLVTNFCYPRFFDYRTNSLRMRPVDRVKRQEVWHYLNSIDLSSWNRLDLASPDFQRQVERLFIQYVQRNRNFFGEQGRKRMPDIRMLITASSTAVVQGLRMHLTMRDRTHSPFGGPRPAVVWSTLHQKGELSWEQIASSTMVLQQQLQEVRGEIKPPTGEVRPAIAPARRPGRVQPAASAPGSVEHSPATVPVSRPAPQDNVHSTVPLPEPKSTTPLNPTWTSTPVPTSATAAPHSHKVDPVVEPIVAPPTPVIPASPVTPRTPAPESVPVPASPPSQEPVQERAVSQRESASVVVSEEDVAIFEEMRRQLLVWLRIETVRAGMDISGQSSSQLLELLHQQDRVDETRLQVISTLLNLSNQVIKNGQASLLDYKQAMMFHLMHTRRS